MTRWPCRTCGEQRTPEGYDPCVGWLAGAQHVCCGHDHDGVNRYVATDNGRIFRGLTAFQQWARWVRTREGRTVVAAAPHTRRFGWLGGQPGRNLCSACLAPHYECVCFATQQPGQYGNRVLWHETGETGDG